VKQKHFRTYFFATIFCTFLSVPAHAGGGSCDRSSSNFQGTACACHPNAVAADKRNVLHLQTKSDAGAADLYCYKKDNLSWQDVNGESKECDLSGNKSCPSSVEDLLSDTTGKFSKCDCLGTLDSLLTFRPLCESSLCQVCKSGNDCEKVQERFKTDWDSSKDSAQCMTPLIGGTKYERKKRVCGLCKNIGGNGWKKITLVVRGYSNNQDIAEEIVATIRSFEPFGYLFNSGTFTFQYADFPFNSFITRQLVEEPAGSGKYKYSSGTEAMLKSATKQVCPNTDVVIFIDKDFPATGIGGYTRQDGTIYSAGYGATVAHELGHSICGLTDEYFIPEKERFIASTLHGLNENAKNIDRNECGKFKDIDPKIPCIPITSSQNEGGTYKKSSNQSLMNNDNKGFNLMSCVGCLEKLTDSTSNVQRANICRGLSGVVLP
jgi:hypothetical protein